MLLPLNLNSNKYLVFSQANLSSHGGNTNYIFTHNFTTTSFSVVYTGYGGNISFVVEEY